MASLVAVGRVGGDISAGIGCGVRRVDMTDQVTGADWIIGAAQSYR